MTASAITLRVSIPAHDQRRATASSDTSLLARSSDQPVPRCPLIATAVPLAYVTLVANRPSRMRDAEALCSCTVKLYLRHVIEEGISFHRRLSRRLSSLMAALGTALASTRANEPDAVEMRP